MKNAEIKGYTSPVVDMTLIEVESGFATSGVTVDDAFDGVDFIDL